MADISSNSFYADEPGFFSRMFGGIFRRALRLSKRSWINNISNNNKSPVIVDMENLVDVYATCPHLNIIINKKAEMLSNGRMLIRKTDTKEELPNDPLLALINNPNPLQNRKQFIIQYSIYNDIFSNSFFFKNKAFSNSLPKTLWNLPPNLMEIVPTGKLYDQIDERGIIEKYKLYVETGYKEYTIDEVCHFANGISKNQLIAESKLISLQFPISNIIGSLKTRNIFIYYGPKQLISNQVKDASGGGVPIGEKERKRIEHELQQEHYGIDDRQSSAIITDASLKVEMMQYPTKDLMLFEEIEDDAAAIAGAFGISKFILPFFKDSTFENAKQGMIDTYQNTIIPASETLCEIYNYIYGLLDTGKEFFMDYSYLPILQEDAGKKASARKMNAEMFALLFNNGIISKEQFALEMGVDPDGVERRNIDTLGKIPLALQQLALARERANTAGDGTLSAAIGQAMDTLTNEMVVSVINKPDANS